MDGESGEIVTTELAEEADPPFLEGVSAKYRRADQAGEIKLSPTYFAPPLTLW